jgi:acetylornithine deacetylase/succinyl-diaminopimelate desuccinylase-like protein
MKDIHTTNENIALEDMVKCGEFLLEAIKVYSKV